LTNPQIGETPLYSDVALLKSEFHSYEVAYGGSDNPSGVPIGYAHIVELGDPKRGQRPKPYLLPAVKKAVPPYKKQLRASIIRSWEKNVRAHGISGEWKIYGPHSSIKFIRSMDKGRA